MGSPREKIPTIPHIRLAPHRAEPVRDVTLLPASSKHTVIGALEFPNSKSYKVTNAVTRVANRANAIHIWRRGLDVHARPSCKSGTQSQGRAQIDGGYAYRIRPDHFAGLREIRRHFGAAQAAITFDAQYLSLPLRRDEKALQNMLRRALPLTVRQYRSDRLMVLKLRDVLRAHCTELHAGDSVARALNVSLRTLHRRLLEEGTSLQKEKNVVRRDLAIERLVRTSRSIKQVARDVGFHNEKSFMRAFKQWTGKSPVEYRRKAIPRS
jgi:AraC-like DNA-binding protein